MIVAANHYTIDAGASAIMALTGLALAAVLPTTPKISTTVNADNVIAWRPSEQNMAAADSDHTAA